MNNAYRPELTERMRRLGIIEADLEEQFVRSSGPGGQHVNKVSTCVRLRHTPTGIEVRCQAGRSRSANREQARNALCEKLESARRARICQQARTHFLRVSRIKAQKRSAKQRKLMRQEKTHRSGRKNLRRRPCEDD
jgi:protein subunit release factor B